MNYSHLCLLQGQNEVLFCLFVTLLFCCGNYCQLINSAFYDLWENEMERLKSRGCC